MNVERQLSRGGEFNHELDQNDNFSRDDRFLVFDTRTDAGGIVEGQSIGKIDVSTGEVTVLYEVPGANAFGPGSGAASYSPVDDEVVFIHGPLRPTSKENEYDKHRRVGLLVRADGSGESRPADARDVEAPFLRGALRGGTHRHEFLGQGGWLGFTYNDAVMKAYGASIGRDLDLRTIGVTRLGHEVEARHDDSFPSRAAGFSVLVVVVTPEPEAGTDEISCAAQDSWVGEQGYLREDGTRQLARAFIGTVRDRQGQEVDEVFVVDIPDDVTVDGPLGPLQGTATTFPMPPRGAQQRRLTRTADEPLPGCRGIVRASPDGESIAFLRRDGAGAFQVFLISPWGGPSRQVSAFPGGVDGPFRWHPSGRALVLVAGSELVQLNVDDGPRRGEGVVLTRGGGAPFAPVVSHDGKTVAFNRKVAVNGRSVSQIFLLELPKISH